MKLPELESWFNEQELPRTAKMEHYFIHDIEKFVIAHITTLKYNSGNLTYMPYYERLMDLKAYLEKNN